ncbi:MAG: ABC-2 family transporter protein [Oligoflexales bacterium]|nr:ABC-2 family transporter protein [Oligoflexales bacterium]
MKKQFLHYFSIYKQFLTINVAAASQFRLNFVLLILMDMIAYTSSLLLVDFIYKHVEQIGIWQRNEFMFFISFMLVVDHLHMTFVSENFWNFAYDIRTGRFDFNLLKPVSSIFISFFYYIRPASLLVLPFPWACLIYFGLQSDLSHMAWVSLPFLIVLSLGFWVCFEILLSISTFWLIEGYGINFLRVQLQQISRWPDFSFSHLVRKFFILFIPVLVVGSFPVRFLLDQRAWMYIVYMLAGLLVLVFLIRRLWGVGLKYYESASS